jgi:hypothetical protein
LPDLNPSGSNRRANLNSEVAKMEHFKSPPMTTAYVRLESWKMIIIVIVREGVLIWTKWLAAKILGLSALLRLARRQKQNSLRRFWNMAGPFTA